MKGRLRTSLLGAFAGLGGVLAVGLLAGFWGSQLARTQAAKAAASEDLRYQASTRLRQLLDLQAALGQYLKSGDDLYRQRFDKIESDLRTSLASMVEASDKDLQRERLKTAAALLEQWLSESARPQAQAKRQLLETKVGTLVDPSKGEKLFRDLRTLLEEYEAGAGEDTAQARKSLVLAFGRLNWLILVATLLAGAVAAGILFHTLKTVARPLEGILAWVQALRAGKPFTLEIAAPNEIEAIGEEFLRLGEEFRHARREFESVAIVPEANPHPILELKLTGEVVYANPSAKTLAERLGITPAELLPPDTPKQLEAIAGREGTVRKEKVLGEARYEFIFRAMADKEFIFAVALPARQPLKK